MRTWDAVLRIETILTIGPDVIITDRQGQILAEFTLEPDLDYHPKKIR